MRARIIKSCGETSPKVGTIGEILDEETKNHYLNLSDYILKVYYPIECTDGFLRTKSPGYCDDFELFLYDKDEIELIE